MINWHKGHDEAAWTGLSVWDHFFIAAMTALLAAGKDSHWATGDAAEIADRMAKEREKRRGQ